MEYTEYILLQRNYEVPLTVGDFCVDGLLLGLLLGLHVGESGISVGLYVGERDGSNVG